MGELVRKVEALVGELLKMAREHEDPEGRLVACDAADALLAFLDALAAAENRRSCLVIHLISEVITSHSST